MVQIVGDASSLDKALGHASKSAQRFSVGIGSIVKSAVVWKGVTAGIDAVTGAIGSSIDEWQQQQVVLAQTQAALTSTGGAANVTAKHVDSLAGSLSNLSGIDDEVIQGGENILLTFTQIQNRVGKGNDVFDQATKAVTDLSVAMGMDMKSAALQVGKALNDPLRGYARLQRIGVAFTKEQAHQIKAFTAVGDVASAQRVILGELTREFGGSAAALGKTVPGEFNRIRESLRNVGGALVGSIAPGAAAALEQVNQFVNRIAKARTVRAKLQVVWDGVREAFVALERELVSAFNRINWQAVWQNVQQIARSLLTRLEAAFASIDFAHLGTTLGSKFGKVADALAKFIRGIDWQHVGTVVVRGILIGLGAITVLAVQFMRKALPKLVRLWIAEAKAIGGLLAGMGKALIQPIVDAASGALTSAGRFLEQKALSLVLKIIEPFSHIPRRLGGGWAQDLKKNLQGELDKLNAPVKASATAVGQSIGAGITEGISGYDPRVEAQMKATVGKAIGAAQSAAADASSGDLPPTPKLPGKKMTKAELAARRNQWFDAYISRLLGDVQDIPSLKGQIAQLRMIRGLVVAREALTKDLTRRVNLGEQAKQISRQIRSTQAQQASDAKTKRDAAKQRKADRAQARIDELGFKVDQARATNFLPKVLRAELYLQGEIMKQIAAGNHTLELRRQLLGVRSDIAQTEDDLATQSKDRAKKRSDRLAAAQFRALGLGPTGEKLPPGLTALKRRYQQLFDAVQGTFADTPKTNAILTRIAAAFKKATHGMRADVRDAVSGMLDDVKKILDQGGPALTQHFQHVGGKAFLSAFGLNLTPAQRRRLMTGLAQIGPGGQIPTGQAAFAGAAHTVGGMTVVMNSPHFHGVTDTGALEQSLTKRQRSRAQTRRNDRAG